MFQVFTCFFVPKKELVNTISQRKADVISNTGTGFIWVVLYSTMAER